MEKLYEILNDNKPYVILLVGVPLSGKSTFLNEYFNNDEYNIVSRYDIIMNITKSSTYNEAWHSIDNYTHKIIDKELKRTLIELAENKESVIIDMTNLTVKGRNNHIGKFPKHFKIAIVFEQFSSEEYIIRNSKREKEKGKSINIDAMKKMHDSYIKVSSDEDLDLIINIKDLKL